MKSPFKFLDSYTREDREIFFGRDQEITELYRRVFESKILLVYGISGTGKSSLINCGLASRFDDSDWLPLNVRRGSNIVDSLNEAFNKQAIRPLKKNLAISEKLQSIYLDHFKPVYLIFDQFEELFIFGSTEEKSEFIKLIKEVVKSETQCKVLFIIREEFLAGITEFEYDLPEIFSNRFRVEKMKRGNAINAIEGPCTVYNIETEPGFAEELIDKLCPAGNEIELTFLQIYLDRIFRLAGTEKQTEDLLRFSNEILTRAGSVSDLLGQFLEEQINEMDDPNTGTSILKSFVSVQGTKKPMKESDIIDSIGAFGVEIKESDLIKYLTKFVDLRILRERDEAGHLELRHDALAAKIYEKFTLTEKELLEVRLFVENAYQAFNTRKTYFNKEDLEYLAIYEKRLFLPSLLREFIEDSKNKLRSQQRALIRLTRIVAVVFLAFIGLGLRYYFNQRDNQKQKELITIALLEENVDPLKGIKTAFDIYEKDSNSIVVKNIILNCFANMVNHKESSGDLPATSLFFSREIPVSGKILEFRMNKSGSGFYGWSDHNEVFIFSNKDTIVKVIKTKNEVVDVELSEDDRFIAVVQNNSSGDIYRQTGENVFSFQTTVNGMINSRLVRFFPARNYFIAAIKDDKAIVYDSTGAILYELKGHSGRINSLDVSPDGRFIVTASCDKKALIWNFNHKTKIFSPYDTIKIHRDTVWSCEFNKKGNFILSASSDSSVRISSLNGIPKNIMFTFATNGPEGISISYPGYEKNLDTTHHYLDSYYKKKYDAKFAANDSVIIVSNYDYKKSVNRFSREIFSSQVVYFGYSGNDFFYTDRNFYKRGSKTISEDPQYFSSWKVSSDRLLFAAISSYNKGIIILTPNGFQLLGIKGGFPLFSKSGENLYYLAGKTIKMIPLNISEIHDLVFVKKVFGDTEKVDEIWKLL